MLHTEKPHEGILSVKLCSNKAQMTHLIKIPLDIFV